jgi:regulatory protein
MLVEVSGDDEPLLVSLETAREHRLVEGVVLTPGQLDQLRLDSQRFRCERKTTDLLARRDHSVGEMIAKLRRAGFSRQVIDPVLRRCRSMGTLDDARYAMTAAKSLMQRRPCGHGYLVAFLQRKRIDRTLAEQTAEMLLSETDESSRARAALETRWSIMSQFELEIARRKAYNYLSRRGFGYQSAKTAFEQLWQGKHEESDH